MTAYLLVGLGGAVGSIARYGVGRMFPLSGFPFATLTVNVIGSLLMGMLAGTLSRAGSAGSEEMRLLLGVGVLGGFTTFSAFSLDVFTLFQRGDLLTGVAYMALSVILSIAGLALGFWLARGVF